MMEVHDIRYLHDSDFSPEEPLENKAKLFEFKKLSLIGSILALVLMIVSTTVIVRSISKPTSTRLAASGLPLISPSLTPIIARVKVEGEIICTESKPTSQTLCSDFSLVYAKKTYNLKNINHEDIVQGKIKPGNKIIIEGNVAQIGDKSSLYVTSIIHYSLDDKKINAQKNSTVSQKSTVPTMASTIEPTPTEIPHHKDSTPQAGINYVTIAYIRENAANLVNTNVHVGAYLVGGLMGVDACKSAGVCTHSIFNLADTNDLEKDPSSYMQMWGKTDEKEEDYTIGQNYYHEVTVRIDNGIVRLDKVY